MLSYERNEPLFTEILIFIKILSNLIAHTYVGNLFFVSDGELLSFLNNMRALAYTQF